MSRILRILSCFVFLNLAFLSAGLNVSHAQVHRPNIIYIFADDLGYGDLGVYGQDKIETPNIDNLAKNGMKFTQHYAFPVCAPSRYLLMTGIGSGKAYIRGNHEWGERGPVWDFKAMEENPYLEGQWPIPDSTITIAEVLKQVGYKTSIVGKWGLGAPFTAGLPNRQGFDYFYGYICQRQDHTYYNGHLWENEDRVPLDNKIISPNTKLPDSLDKMDPKSYDRYQQNVYSPDLLVKAATNFIKNNKQNPFFLYYASPLPHVSLQAPQKWIDYYHAKFGEEKPFLGGSYFPCRYPRATYAAMISTLDEQVGQLVATLKENGLYENTIIMFCSDNGPAYNAGVDPVFFNSAGPFQGQYGRGKGFLFEGGIREPFIVQWPGKIKPGTTSDLVSATIDVMPTLCDLFSLNRPPNVEGVSILPTLLGMKGKQTQHDYLYFEYPEYGGQQAVRMGKWKAIRLNLMKGAIKTQLFDLSTDIKEQNDVAAKYPDIVKKIEDIMKKEHHTPEVSRFLIPALESKGQ
jgi:arylsulfatase A-like enzyme